MRALPILAGGLTLSILLSGTPAAAIACPAVAPTLDGTINAAEWQGATMVTLAPGIHAWVMRDEQAVWFALRTDTFSIAHAYIADAERLEVLHASGSLGKARYQRGDSAWTLTQGFTWELRDPAIRKDTLPTEAAYAAEMTGFQDRHGWLASTVMRGQKGDSEMRIDRRLLAAENSRIGFAFFSGKDQRQIHHWPKDARIADSMVEGQWLMGETPAQAAITPTGLVRFQDIPCRTAG